MVVDLTQILYVPLVGNPEFDCMRNIPRTSPDDPRRIIPQRASPEVMAKYLQETASHDYSPGEPGDC